MSLKLGRGLFYLGIACAVIGVVAWWLLPAPRETDPRIRSSSDPIDAQVGPSPTTSSATEEAVEIEILKNSYAEKWKLGGPTKDGNCLFVNWRPGPGNGAKIYLLTDYGFMLINEDCRHPRPIYLLGFMKERKVEAYRTFSEFRRALRRIPRGSKVYLHTTCTSGTSEGVGEKTLRDVDRAFRKAHLKYNEEDHIMYDICGEGADPLPNIPKQFKAYFVRVYGEKAFAAHYIGRPRPNPY